MGREARVLIHEVSTAAIGKIGEIEDQVTLVHGMQDRVLSIFADRAAQAGVNGTASEPITKARLKRGWSRTDWWLDSDECLRLGIVDEVR
jgi:ATP-dependent protease ClpP protease subunit